MARKTESAPPLDETSRRRLDIGITVIGLCAAAWSAPTLYGLARLIDFPKQLAWLLPAALDGYAATSIWFGKAVPAEHPASDSARRNSRLALALTVSCNGLYHLLTLGGVLIPAWARIALLVVVSSLAPFILDRLLHLRTLAHGTARHSANATAASVNTGRENRTANTAADRQQPAAARTDNGNTPTANTISTTAKNTVNTTVNDRANTENGNSDNGNRRSDEEWVEIARDVYVAERNRLGKRPPEKAFHAALCAELAILAGVTALPAEDTPSLGTAKRVRGLVEAAFPELAPAIHPVAS